MIVVVAIEIDADLPVGLDASVVAPDLDDATREIEVFSVGIEDRDQPKLDAIEQFADVWGLVFFEQRLGEVEQYLGSHVFIGVLGCDHQDAFGVGVSALGVDVQSP